VRSRLGRNWRGRFPAVRPQAYLVRAASFIRSSVTRAYTLWSFRKPLIQRLFCLFAARFGEAHSDPILFAATWARFARMREAFHFASLAGLLGRRAKSRLRCSSAAA